MSLITGLLIISVIAALLALLLEAADAWIADYGTCSIVVNNERDLQAEGGRSLLSTLGEEGIFVPSACGGKGTCAYCKVRILEGGGPLLPTETPYLSEDEVAGSTRLACQVKVKEDLRIEIPREYFQIREYRVLVEKIERLTPAIRAVTLKVLEPEEGITFTPGQYLQLQVPQYKLSSQPEYRAYSIASDAADHQRVELVVTRVEGGLVSTYVHDYLAEGEELIARGPFGDFHLLESGQEILLVATGSGLAPLRSILFQIEREGVTRRTTLLFGGRRPEDLFYVDELKGFEKRLENFTFVPVLSRPAPEDHWEGETGRVTDFIERNVPDKAPVDAHLCGSPRMVRSCIELLSKKGVSADQIAYDKFE